MLKLCDFGYIKFANGDCTINYASCSPDATCYPFTAPASKCLELSSGVQSTYFTDDFSFLSSSYDESKTPYDYGYSSYTCSINTQSAGCSQFGLSISGRVLKAQPTISNSPQQTCQITIQCSITWKYYSSGWVTCNPVTQTSSSITLYNTCAACTQSVCQQGSYSKTLSSSTSFQVQQYSGTSYYNIITPVALSEYFNFPGSCNFDSCALLYSQGTSTSQGWITSDVTASYSGIGSLAQVQFTIKTSSAQSNSYFLSCKVSALTATGTTCGSSGLFIYTSSKITFESKSCYSKVTPPDISYSWNSGTISSTIDVSQYIVAARSECTLSSCSIVTNSGWNTPNFLTTTQSGTSLTIQVDTSSVFSSQSVIIKCYDYKSNTLTSNSFNYNITCSLSLAVCDPTKYTVKSISYTQFNTYQNTGTSNLITVATYPISNFFNFPDSSCQLISCNFAYKGSSLAQGSISSYGSVSYSGLSSSATIQFIINTTSTSLSSYYLSCLVPSITASQGICSSSQQYIYSDDDFGLRVLNCYSAQSPSAISYLQNTNSGSVSISVDSSTFIKQENSAQCSLTSCLIIYSSNSSTATFLTLTQGSGTAFTLAITTANAVPSQNFRYKCTINGGSTFQSSTFTAAITCSQSVCQSGSYSYTGTTSPNSYTAYFYEGTSNQKTQPSVLITQYFSIPGTSCAFSSCCLVSAKGTSTSQGTINSNVVATYSGTGSSAYVAFTMNTSQVYSSTPLYLSCTVPESSASSVGTCSYSQFYVFSSNSITFQVNSCYAALTHVDYTFLQGTSATATVSATDFISQSHSTLCALSSCSIVDSSNLSVPSYVTLTLNSGLSYSLNFDTTASLSTALIFQCSGNGGIIQKSNSFQLTITCTVSTCTSGSYQYSGTSTPTSFEAFQYTGTYSSPSQYLFNQASESLSQYFNIPTSCSFSSCSLVSAKGSSSVQGILSQKVTATISVTGSPQSVTFQMNTATTFLEPLYLSCTVKAAAASGSTCAVTEFYVFSSNSIAFQVKSCYTPLTHAAYSYTQGTSAYSTVLATDFIDKNVSTLCILTSCQILDSTTSTVPSYVNFISTSGLSYSLNFSTDTILSAILKLQCSGTGGITQSSNTFQFQVTACVPSICSSSTSYQYTGTSTPSSFNAYQYFGAQISASQYLFNQSQVSLSQYFNIPTSCSFSTCSLVSVKGSSSVQGTLNTQFSANISGTGSTKSVIFQMNTATTFSGSLYLSCTVQDNVQQDSTCAVNQFYVYSSNQIAFTVQNCYAPQTPANIILYQNEGGGSVGLDFASSTIMQIKDSSCTLTCTLASSQSQLTLSITNSTYYKILANTNSAVASTSLKYTCQGTGGPYDSNSFTFQITDCIPSVCASGYNFSGISNPSAFSVYQYSGISNMNIQTAINISQYFTIPTSCTFTSCSLVTPVGSSTTQGTLSTMVTSVYSSSKVEFNINTSTVQSQNLYLGCLVPASPISGTTCQMNQFYVYSTKSISFNVENCYSPQTPDSYTYQQYYSSGSVTLSIYVSSFITVKDSSCPLSNCLLVDSKGAAPNFMKLSSITNWQYQLVLNTSQQVVQQTQFYQCQGYGGDIYSKQFTFEVGYSCLVTSTSIKAPSSIRTQYQIPYQQGKITNLTINNFTSSNSACPIIKHSLTVHQSLTSVPTFIKIQEGSISFSIINQTMGSLSNIYSFYICAQALGGAVLYAPISIQIINDCSQDQITMNHAVPDSSEQMPSSYKIINFYPVLFLNTTTISPISVDISKRITNLFTTDCPLIKYQISKAKINNQIVDNSTFGYYFTLTSNGVFQTLSSAPSSIYNSEVFIQANNNQIWGGDQLQYLIDVTIIVDENSSLKNSSSNSSANNQTDQSQSSQLNQNKNQEKSNSTTKSQNGNKVQQSVLLSTYFSDFFKKKIKGNKYKQNTLDTKNNKVVNYCTMKSLTVNNKGQATIKFSEQMNTRFNISWINQSNTIIFVQPQDKRQLETDFNSSKLDLSWAIDSFQNDLMKINLNFYNPLQISPSILQDQLFIVFSQSQSLINCIQNKTEVQLRNDSLSIRQYIPKQKIYDSSAYSLQQTSGLFNSSATWVMILALIFMFIGDSSKDHWVVFIRSLQLVITQAMINIVIPANYLSLLQALSSIAFYDIFEQYNVWSYFPFLTFLESEVPNINQQMQSIAFNKRDAFSGLGTVTIFIFVYLARILLVILLAIFISITLQKYLKKIHLKRFSQDLFFNTILSLTIESYLELIVYGYLNFITYEKSNNKGEILSLMIAVFSISTSFILLPSSLSWAIILKTEKELKSIEFQESWGAIFEFINTKKKMARFYNLVYIIRRLIIVILWIYKDENGGLLLVTIILLNIIYTIYMAEAKAFETNLLNYQDFMNEFVVATSLYWKMLYSNMVQTQEDQYYFAKMELCYILFYCFINLVLIVLQTLFKNKKVFIYIYNLALFKYNLHQAKSKRQKNNQNKNQENDSQFLKERNQNQVKNNQEIQLTKTEIQLKNKSTIFNQVNKVVIANKIKNQQQIFEQYQQNNDKTIEQKIKKEKQELSKYNSLQELCQQHLQIFCSYPFLRQDFKKDENQVSILGVQEYDFQDGDNFYQVTEKELKFKNNVFLTFFGQNKSLNMEIKKLKYEQFMKELNNYYRTQIKLRKLK